MGFLNGIRVAMLLLCFAISVTMVQAQYVLDTTVDSHKKLQIKNGTFSFSFVPEENRTFVKVPVGSNFIVSGETCEHNQFFRACVKSISDPVWNETLYRDTYDLDVTVEEILPDMDIVMDVSKNNVTQGEAVEVLLTIKYLSSTYAGNLSVVVDTGTLHVQDASGCGWNKHHLLIREPLQEFTQISCTATMLAAQEGSTRLSKNITVHNGYSIVSERNETEITVLPSVLTIDREVPRTLFVGRTYKLGYTLQNLHSSSVTVERIELVLPEYIGITQVSEEFLATEQVVTGATDLEPNETRTLTLSVQALGNGSKPIEERYVFSGAGIEEDYQARTYIASQHRFPEVYAQLLPSLLSPNSTAALLVTLHNPDQDMPMRNVLLQTHSINKNHSEIVSLQSGQNKTVLEQYYNMSEVNVQEFVVTLMVSANNRTLQRELRASIVDNTTLNETLQELIARHVTNGSTANLDNQTALDKETERFDVVGENFGHVERLPNELSQWEFNGIPFFPTIYYLIIAITVVVIASIYFLRKKRAEREETPYEIDRFEQERQFK